MATSSVSSLFGECDGLLGFATLQKALDAAFHPDKLWQISFRSLRMKLGSQRSPRAVFPGNFELRPIDLRSDGSEGHLAGINVWEFGVGQFLVALYGRKERVPLGGDLRVGRQTVQVHQPLCLSDCLLIERRNPCGKSVHKRVEFGNGWTMLGIGASKSGGYQNAPALLPGSSQLRKAFFLIGLAQGEKRCALAAPSNAVPNSMLTRYMMRPPAARLPR